MKTELFTFKTVFPDCGLKFLGTITWGGGFDFGIITYEAARPRKYTKINKSAPKNMLWHCSTVSYIDRMFASIVKMRSTNREGGISKKKLHLTRTAVSRFNYCKLMDFYIITSMLTWLQYYFMWKENRLFKHWAGRATSTLTSHPLLVCGAEVSLECCTLRKTQARVLPSHCAFLRPLQRLCWWRGTSSVEYPASSAVWGPHCERGERGPQVDPILLSRNKTSHGHVVQSIP